MLISIDSGANSIDMRFIMRYDGTRNIFIYSMFTTIIIIMVWYSCMIVEANTVSGVSSRYSSSSLSKPQSSSSSSSSQSS